MGPDDGLNQLLPISPPGDQEHESGGPHQVTEQEHPGPDGQVITAERVVSVDQLRGVEPEVIAEPAHQIGAGFVELGHVAGPDRQVLPVPVEGQPTHGVQSPEDSQIESVPGRDIAGAATARAVAGEGITKVLLVGHQLGTAGIQGTLHQDEGGGVQTESDGMVNQEVAWADRQEHVRVAIDGIQPVVVTRDVLGGQAGGTLCIREQHIEAVDRLA